MNVTQLLGGPKAPIVAKLTLFAGTLLVGILAASLFEVRIFQPWTTAEDPAGASVSDLLSAGFSGSPMARTERGSTKPAGADDTVKVLEDWQFTRSRPSNWRC